MQNIRQKMVGRQRAWKGVHSLEVASALAMALVLCGGSANAQTDAAPLPAAQRSGEADSSNGEIVVTAQRRAQTLDKVGISITAFSGDQIQSMGISSATELAARTPGVVLESSGGSGLNGNLTMRGVAATDFVANQESPNAVYFDDIYVSSPYETNFPIYDLERVEILRGPQGTLFGRNSTGGLANFITKKPSDEWNGYVDVTLGSYNQRRMEAAVGGPISSRTEFRLSGLFDYADGWWKNAEGRNTNQSRYWGIRAQLKHELSDTIRAYLSFSYDRNPRALVGTYDAQPAYLNASGQPELLPADVDAYGTGPGNDRTGYRDPYPGARKSAFNSSGFLKKERISPTLKLEWDVADGITVSSLSNYTKFRFDYAEDCDGTPIDACYYPSGQRLRQWSEEMRIAKDGDHFNWQAGIYVLDIKQNNYQRYEFPAYAGTPFAFNDENLFSQHVRSYSLYAQGDYALTDRLKVTIGGRILHDKKTFSSQVYFHEAGDGTTDVVYNPALLVYDFSKTTVGDLAQHSEWLWSGRAQIDYTASSNALIYASVSRGVKGGGFNSNLGSTTSIEDTPFQNETMIAYEAGTKLKFFDRAVRLNLSGFYYDYSDFQAFQLQGLTSFVTNNDARMYGGEVELTVTPMRGLDLSFGAAYLRTKIYDVNTSYDGIRDQQAVNAPRWSLNGTVKKTFEFGDNDLSLIYDVNYQTKRFSSVDNNFLNTLPAATIQNARVNFDLKNYGITVSGFVKNIANTAKQVSAFDYLAVFGTRIVTYVPPRWYGIELRKDF